jgi:hypothetical protein
MARTAQQYLNDILPGKVIERVEYDYPDDVIDIFLIGGIVLTISVLTGDVSTRSVVRQNLLVEINDQEIYTDDY